MADVQRALGARPARQRNPRGEGARLRDEIIVGATAVLERTGSEETVTLRAIAREVGIAVPSISRHFKDQPEIIDSVVAREVEALLDRLTEAATSTDDPVERLFAMCRAYVDYGFQYPSRYRVVVGRRFLDAWETQNRVMEQSAPLLASALGLVVTAVQACIDAGASAGTDAFMDTVVLWFTLHGFITVPQAITTVPWPERDGLLEACVTRAARLQPRSPKSGRRSRTGQSRQTGR